jgi:tRNA 2-thiouridine synthesizing protein B
MLHTLHRSPWLTDFAALLRLLSEGDELLLLQDGVTAQLTVTATLKVCVMPPLRSMP